MIFIMPPINDFSSYLPAIVTILEVPIWVSLQERTCYSTVKSAVSWQPLAVNALKPILTFERRPCSSWDSPQPMAEHRVGAKPGHFFQHGTPLVSNLCSGIPHWVDQNLLRSAFWSEALSSPAFSTHPLFFFFIFTSVTPQSSSCILNSASVSAPLRAHLTQPSLPQGSGQGRCHSIKIKDILRYAFLPEKEWGKGILLPVQGYTEMRRAVEAG